MVRNSFAVSLCICGALSAAYNVAELQQLVGLNPAAIANVQIDPNSCRAVGMDIDTIGALASRYTSLDTRELGRTPGVANVLPNIAQAAAKASALQQAAQNVLSAVQQVRTRIEQCKQHLGARAQQAEGALAQLRAQAVARAPQLAVQYGSDREALIHELEENLLGYQRQLEDQAALAEQRAVESARLRGQLDAMQKDVQRMQDATQQQLQEVQRQLTQAQQAGASAQDLQMLEQELQRAQQANEQAARQTASLEQEITKMRADAGRAASSMSDLQQRLDEAEKKGVSSQDEIDRLRAEMNKDIQAQNDLKGHLNKVAEERTTLLRDAAKRMQDADLILRKLAAEPLDRIQSVFEAALAVMPTEARSRFNIQVERIGEAVSNFRQSHEDVKKQLEEAQASVVTLTQQLNEARTQATQAAAAKSDDERVAALRKQNDELNRQLAETEGTLHGQQVYTEKQVATVAEQVQALKEKLLTIANQFPGNVNKALRLTEPNTFKKNQPDANLVLIQTQLM